MKKTLKESFISNFQRLNGILLNEDLLFENTNRIIYNDISKMFMENNLKNGMFVNLGYLNAVDIPKRVFPTEQNELAAKQIINDAENNNLTPKDIELIKSIIENEIWNKTKQGEILNTKKQPKKYFDLPNELSSILQFNRYNFNWMDMNSLSKNYDTQRNSEIEIRKKYGFGKEENEYPENDWRKKLSSTGRPKYRNTHLDPSIDKQDSNRGSSYKEKIGDFPIYGDVDMDGNTRIDPKLNQQRMALRQNISSALKRPETLYFYVDPNGNLNNVSENFVDFISNKIKELKQSTSISDELDYEEDLFSKEMEQLNKKYFVTQFLTNRIAYLTATVVDDKSKESKPIYFLNNNIDLLQEFNIDKAQIDNLVNKFIKITN